ncbi:3-isopropylmalate dehydrogenase [Plectosphaerella plurivora]|uniref:3-isopropylmalate dehydrogenase n=1 Tax=Plectosphaerella plurivora TaxID=936078 RepID=A0A9P8V7Y0_9PEZI|nr:3-isopropylmalate dehydrogenase [Plectosphaerella plurivora]
MKRILVLPGDGVGPEVIAEALKVLRVVDEHTGIGFDIENDLFGGCSIDQHGVPITEEVIAKAKSADAVLAGAVGGPQWGVGKVRPEEGLLQLREALDAYANLRPCRFPSKSLHHLSALKNSELLADVDFVLLRENCGGAYFGPKEESDDVASDSWLYTREEVQRISRVAIALASDHNPPLQVISTDKANVLASSRLWRRVVTETFAAEAPAIKPKHQLADSAAMLMMKYPRMFDGILLADNTFGDILSDEASVIIGSLGLLPSASLSGVPSAEGVKGFYEPVHGSAPDIAGKGIANPIATILSVGMMLRYSFNMKAQADAVDEAVRVVLDSREAGGREIRTGDIGGQNTTAEVGDAVAAALAEILAAKQ